jgi:hypothetical protein
MLSVVLMITTLGGLIASHIYEGNKKYDKLTNLSYSVFSFIFVLTLIAAFMKAADIL